LEELAPTVSPGEAARVAKIAVEYPQQLARDYRVVKPALFHNLLVNVRLRQRGLCYQWAEDLLAQLEPMNLQSLQVHWAIAYGGSFREHNALVITAQGQLFTDGIILDAWRNSGRLFWCPVLDDRYPWKEAQLKPAEPSVVSPK
jgi:hypothetical protein